MALAEEAGGGAEPDAVRRGGGEAGARPQRVGAVTVGPGAAWLAGRRLAIDLPHDMDAALAGVRSLGYSWRKTRDVVVTPMN